MKSLIEISSDTMFDYTIRIGSIRSVEMNFLINFGNVARVLEMSFSHLGYSINIFTFLSKYK